MDAPLWKRIGELFKAARELDGDQRDRYLSEQCGGDQALLEQLHSLLDTDRKQPTVDCAPTVTVLNVPSVIAQRFRVVRFIAGGGMGTVYEAEDLQLNERVALKTIRAEISSDAKAVERFKQEVHLGKSVTHPNVCRLHDLVVDHSSGGAEVLYLSMQFLEGETLATRIKRGRLPEVEALPMIEDMADALSAAHRSDVIHRDFKSGNVMLVPRPDRTRAVVTDFGLARTLSVSDPHSHSHMAGTVDYMAPEQIRGEELTPAADIYALGVVMYEMVTGRLPFVADSKITVALKHLNDQPIPPRDLVPALDPKWNETILRCLRKTPNERFQSAEQVKAALVQAGPFHRRRQDYFKRHKLIGGLLAVSAVLLLVAVAVVIARSRRENPPPPPAEPPRIAILPFDTRGTSGDLQYFGDGLADEIAGLLSRVRTLQVISPYSVQRFRNTDLPLSEVGRQLRARFFVTGSVEGGHSQVRIRVRMLDASTGIVWARTYDRSPKDTLSIENEVAEDVVHSLSVTLGKDESRAISTPVTQNPRAFDAYIRGTSLVRIFNNRGREEDFSAAEEALRKATQLDPQMAAAYGELAHLYFLHDVERGRQTTNSDRLRVAAEQALALDPKQVAALDTLAITYQATGGTDAAYRFALKVLALNPHDPGALEVLGAVYGNNGMLEDSLLAFRKAGDAEPLYLYPMTNAAEALVMLGRSDEAWEENQGAAAIEPDNYSVLLKSAWIRYHQGRFDEAEQLVASAESHLASTERAAADIIRAWIYSRRGQHPEAQALLLQAEQSPLVKNSVDFQLWLAEGWTLENQPAKALPILSRVAQLHPNYPWFVRNSNLQSLHGNPDFERLMADLKVEWKKNAQKFQRAVDLLGGTKLSSALYSAPACPAAARYSIDSPIPSMPNSCSIKLSANAAVQNGASLSAVAVRQNVWQKWPASRYIVRNARLKL